MADYNGPRRSLRDDALWLLQTAGAPIRKVNEFLSPIREETHSALGELVPQGVKSGLRDVLGAVGLSAAQNFPDAYDAVTSAAKSVAESPFTPAVADVVGEVQTLRGLSDIAKREIFTSRGVPRDEELIARHNRAAGASPEEIWNQQGLLALPYKGWWPNATRDRGATAPLREIPDYFGIIDPDFRDIAKTNKAYLPEILHHPEYFKVHPEAKDIVVRAMPQGSTASATMDPWNKIMRIGDTAEPGAVFHELQHYTSGVDRGPNGISPTLYTSALRNHANTVHWGFGPELYSDPRFKKLTDLLSDLTDPKDESRTQYIFAHRLYGDTVGEGLARAADVRSNIHPKDLRDIYPGAKDKEVWKDYNKASWPFEGDEADRIHFKHYASGKEQRSAAKPVLWTVNEFLNPILTEQVSDPGAKQKLLDVLSAISKNDYGF